MRVLHFHPGNLYGGIERMLVGLAELGVSAGLEQQFAVCWEGRLARELRAARVRPIMLGEVRLRCPASVHRARAALRAEMHGEGTDWLMVHSVWSEVVAGRGLRSALYLHDPARRSGWLDQLAQRMAQPELMICNSRYTAESAGWLHPGAHSVVLHPAVPPAMPYRANDTRRHIRTELETAADSVVIVHVGRMERWKGQARLLRAIAALRADPRWTCWLVGGAQRQKEVRYVESLRSLAVQLGIADRIRFAGERTDVDTVLRAADVFCQPNTRPEPFGMTLIEALRAGLPIVTTAAGGALEILDAESGVLIRPGDDRSLVEALARLIASDEARSRFREHGPQRAVRLTDPAMQVAALGRILAEANVRSTSRS